VRDSASVLRQQEEAIVAKVTPYWTTEDEDPAVYHNQSECEDGKRIKPENKETGSNPPSGRRLCKVCADLA
jgi:hypothetical protein